MTQPPPPANSRQAELVALGAAATLMTMAQFTALRRMMTDRLSSVLVGMFRGLGSWRDPDSERFAAQAVPLVQGAQRALASVTSTYIADQASRANGFAGSSPAGFTSAVDLRDVAVVRAALTAGAATSNVPDQAASATSQAPSRPHAGDATSSPQGTKPAPSEAGHVPRPTGQRVAPPPVPDSETVNLRGVDPLKVYHRPFVTMRVALSKGEDFSTAVDRGANRLDQIAEGDMQQTFAHAARASMQALPEAVAPTGWRRVLQGKDNCGACVAASTQVYSTGTLNPLHPKCDCSVEMIFGSHPAVSPERKAEVMAALEEIMGDKVKSYKNLRGLVVEHGELGPILVRPKDHFTSEADLNNN